MSVLYSEEILTLQLVVHDMYSKSQQSMSKYMSCTTSWRVKISSEYYTLLFCSPTRPPSARLGHPVSSRVSARDLWVVLRARPSIARSRWSSTILGRNSTSFTRPFLAGRRARGGHETSISHPVSSRVSARDAWVPLRAGERKLTFLSVIWPTCTHIARIEYSFKVSR